MHRQPNNMPHGSLRTNHRRQSRHRIFRIEQLGRRELLAGDSGTELVDRPNIVSDETMLVDATLARSIKISERQDSSDATLIDLEIVTPADSPPAAASWDLNNDGVFGDVTGPMATISIDDASKPHLNEVRVRTSDGDRYFEQFAPIDIRDGGLQNPVDVNDVDASGSVTAADALQIINRLNRDARQSGSIRLPIMAAAQADLPYIDANGDNRLSAADALQVINSINRPIMVEASSSTTSMIRENEVIANTADTVPRNTVAAEVSRGVLSITGNHADNEIAVVAYPFSSDALFVQGIGGTLINGRRRVTFDRVHSIQIAMRGGNDLVSIQTTNNFRKDFSRIDINTGSGDDVVSLERIRTTELLAIRTYMGSDLVSLRETTAARPTISLGSGDDLIAIHESRFTEDVTILTGPGNDVADIRGNTFTANAELTNRHEISMGDGDDQANFFDNSVQDNMRLIVHGGLGSDSGFVDHPLSPGYEFTSENVSTAVDRVFQSASFDRLDHARSVFASNATLTTTGNVTRIVGSFQSDRILIESVRGQAEYIVRALPGTLINGQSMIMLPILEALDVDLGNGDDEVFLRRDVYDFRSISGSVDIQTGNGDDLVSILRQTIAGQINVNTGNGNDLVIVRLADNGGTNIDLGDGDDALDYFNNQTTGQTLVKGGNGDDYLAIMYSQFGLLPAFIASEDGDDYVFDWFNVARTFLVKNGGSGLDTYNGPTTDSYVDGFENRVSNWVESRDTLERHLLHPRSLRI